MPVPRRRSRTRSHSRAQHSTGMDSLVDIVSNAVGILVILAVFMALAVSTSSLQSSLPQNTLTPETTQPPQATQNPHAGQAPEAPPESLRRLEVPWSHQSGRRTLFFYLHQGRVQHMDLRPFFRELARSSPQGALTPQNYRLEGLQLRYFPVSHTLYCLELHPERSGGELWARAQGVDSAWKRTLSEYDPRTYTPFFWVVPDSFALFHQVRAQLHEQGYELGWKPTRAKVPLEYCSGFGASSTFQSQ